MHTFKDLVKSKQPEHPFDGLSLSFGETFFESFKDALYTSPTFSAYRLFKNPLFDSTITPDKKLIFDSGSPLISKEDYEKHFNTLDGWHEKLTFDRAEFNFNYRKSDRDRAKLIHLGKKGLAGNTAALLGGFAGFFIDPCNMLINTLFLTGTSFKTATKLKKNFVGIFVGCCYINCI